LTDAAAVSREPAAVLRSAARERVRAGAEFFERHEESLARLCHACAGAFARGGRLVALAATPTAESDARHVAVEFVHPVIVGKRALPALALTSAGGALADQVALLVAGDDIVIGFGADGDAAAADAIALARERGALTIGFTAGGGDAGAEHRFEPPSADPYIRQELVETLYHIVWELVHVFFEHRGLLDVRNQRGSHNAGAASFLYPFLVDREAELEPVVEDVRRSVALKAEEIGKLREQTLTDNAGRLIAAAAALRTGFGRGGKLLALGNGGSATDAMDAVADFRAPPAGAPSGTPGRPAIDLSSDPAILTAIANDIGVEAIFKRQVIAYGSAGDALLALSTSGNSSNVIEALDEARRRDLVTIAMVGYDGGRIAAERLADHVIVTRSEHIPRIQEAQASAYHVLRGLVG
jgi:D-sedoheptulose 7-phosphate isomerase